MLFNYDLFEIVAIAFIVSGILTFSLYNSSPTINNDSLVNTSFITIPSENITPIPVPNSTLLQSNLQNVGVQTEASVETVNTYVNTGMQTSPRMWLESIRNWITEILGTPTSQNSPGYLDVAVQTDSKPLWQNFTDWVREVFSVPCSDVGTFGHDAVDNWRNNLDSIQSVDHVDSESPLTIIRFGIDSPLNNLIVPEDSASQITAVSSVEQIVPVIPYDINDVETYNNLLVLQDAKFSSVILEGVQQYFVILGDAILSINPAVINMNLFC